MSQEHVIKRGNLFQYRFEIALQGGTRKYINKSGFKQNKKLMKQEWKRITNIQMLVILSNLL